MIAVFVTLYQGCSLSLVLVLKVERLGLESLEKSNILVLRVQRLGLEDITSRSRVLGFVTLGLVNIHAMHQACGYYREENIGSDPQETGCQVTDFTSYVFETATAAVSRRFLECLGLVSVLS